MSFNLSEWAVRHRPLVLFLMLAITVAGTLSFLRLGRAEDPNFSIKVGNGDRGGGDAPSILVHGLFSFRLRPPELT
jgi:hypothetical protein